MTITVRTLPTAYDPPDDGVSLATPTCCCCCCCCLATIGGASMFLGTEAYYRAAEQPQTRPRRWWAFVSGFLSLVGVPLLVAVVVPGAAGLALVLAPVLAWAALATAGAGAASAARVVVVTLLIGIGAFALEFGMALATVFLIELTVPLTMFAGWAIARRRHRARTGPVDPPWPAQLPPPPPHGWPDAGQPPHQPPPPPTMS